MKKLFALLFIFSCLFASAQDLHIVGTPGSRVMTDPVSGALTSQAELVHQPVTCMTTGILPANTYNNGASGVGATLTANANGAIGTIDGVTITSGMRILVNNEANQAHNGIYTVTQVGDASHPYILTRGGYSSLPANLVAGSSVFVQQGTANANTQWYQQTTGTINVGVTNIVYSKLAGLGGSYLAIANNLSEIAANGSTAQAAAQANLGVVSVAPLTSSSEDTSLNSSFIVVAACIPRATNSYVVPDTIAWSILAAGSGGHANLFFDSISAEPSDQRMKIWFPPVKNINTVLMTVDETMAGQGIVTGASVGLNYADFQATQPILIGYSFHGNGSGGYVNDGAFTDYSAALYGASYQVGITYTGTPLPHDAEFGPVTYQGPNQYTIENVTSGLGSYNKVFRIVTPGGGYLSTNPTTSDHFVLGPTGIEYQNFNLAVYNAWNASVASSFANFWVIGVFECYIVGNSVSPTSAQIRFQTNLKSTDPYAGATTYDIYRDVTRQFTSPTLVYSGTAGTFVDNGLSPNHVYYYEYVPMNGGTPIASPTAPAYPWFPIVTNH